MIGAFPFLPLKSFKQKITGETENRLLTSLFFYRGKTSFQIKLLSLFRVQFFVPQRSPEPGREEEFDEHKATAGGINITV